MSWILFLDESGHDHKQLPYEVRGGICIHAQHLWPFIQEMQRLEYSVFGAHLAHYGRELKGCKLLDKDRIRWAAQLPTLSDEERRKACRLFLAKGVERGTPTRMEFTAYGQACLEMARGLFQIMQNRAVCVFAAAIPRGAQKPRTFEAAEYLRKDHVFLLQRYFEFLETRGEHGLLVMDEVEKTADKRFVRQLQAYFTRTQRGRFRATWIVPAPFFVASDMAYPIQAADLAIYCINWGFRMPLRGMDAGVRQEIADEFGPWLGRLQFKGEWKEETNTYTHYGIVYVPDPYEARHQ